MKYEQNELNSQSRNELPGKFIVNITLKNNLSVSQLLIFDEIIFRSYEKRRLALPPQCPTNKHTKRNIKGGT